MKVSFVSVPMADLCAPSLGMAQIKGYLEPEQKADLKLYDLNIAFFYYCLTKDKLKKSLSFVREYLKNNKFNQNQNLDKYRCFFECSLEGKYLYKNIDSAIKGLKSKQIYKNWSQYRNLTSIIERSWKLYSMKFYPTIITTGFIAFPQIRQDCSNLNIIVNNIFQNPLIAFYEYYMEKIIKSDTKYLGISINYFEQIVPAVTLANLVKKRFGYIKIIVGGSLFPAYINRKEDLNLLSPYFDAIIPYAGEMVWKQIISKKCLDSISGCWIKNENVFEFNEILLEPIKRTIPDFSDYNLDIYITPERILPYVLSIGCYWGKCTFCSYQYYKDNQLIKPNLDSLHLHILKDFDTLHSLYKTNYYYIVDEAIPLSVSKKLCEYIRKDRLPYHWYGEMRFEHTLSKDTLYNLKAGGCDLIFFGLESGSNSVLKKMNKGTTVETINRVLVDCKNCGIRTMPMLFFGFPTETASDAKKTVSLLKYNLKNIQYLGVGTFILLKNIPVYFYPEKYSIEILKKTDGLSLSLFEQYKVSVGVSPSQAEQILNDVYNDDELKLFFEIVLMSRNHLLFLPNIINNENTSVLFDINKNYILEANSFFFSSFFDWFNQKKVGKCIYYIYNPVKGDIYKISRIYISVISKMKAGSKLVDVLKCYNEQLQNLIIENIKFLCKDGVIIERKE